MEDPNDSSLKICVTEAKTSKQSSLEERFNLELLCVREENAVDKDLARRDLSELEKKMEEIKTALVKDGWKIVSAGRAWLQQDGCHTFEIYASRNIQEQQEAYLESILSGCESDTAA
jgi:hypothetical protein